MRSKRCFTFVLIPAPVTPGLRSLLIIVHGRRATQTQSRGDSTL